MLMWGVVFGAIGFAFFMFGRKQKAPVPLICGLALIGLPYVIGNTITMVLLGLGLMIVPYFIKI